MPYCSLYIHIPFCISKCAYCDFFSVPVREVADDYVDALCNEIRFRLCDISSPNVAVGEGIRTVYIGGGTPSLLTPTQIKKLTDTIYSSLSSRLQSAWSDSTFNHSQTASTNSKPNFPKIAYADEKSRISEFTVEVNPDDVAPELLQSLSDCGVTRISCGIQSLNDDALSFCYRRANRKQILSVLDLFEKHWHGELSLDLISALPNETEKSFLEGLEIVTQTKANHISLYSLTIEEETPLGKMVYSDMESCDTCVSGSSGGKLDYDFDAADRMWLLGRDFLKAKGFSQYEVSNFCRNDKMSVHNLSYWNHESYIGCGSGACGTKRNDDGTSFRWTNTTDLKRYIDFWKKTSIPTSAKSPSNQISQFEYADKKILQTTEVIDKETSMFEFFMMGLRKLSGVRKSEFERIFTHPFPKKVESLFRKWEYDGNAIISDGRYALTENGILFLNKFLSDLGNCEL